MFKPKVLQAKAKTIQLTKGEARIVVNARLTTPQGNRIETTISSFSCPVSELRENYSAVLDRIKRIVLTADPDFDADRINYDLWS